MIRKPHHGIERVIAAVDSLLLYIAGLAVLAAPDHGPASLTLLQAGLVITIGLVVFLWLLNSHQAYQLARYQRLMAAGGDLLLGFGGFALATLAVLGAFLPMLNGDLIALWLGMSAGLLVLARLAVIVGLRQPALRHLLAQRVVIVGASDLIEPLLGQMLDPAYRDQYQLTGIYDDRGDSRRPANVRGIPVKGRIADLYSDAQRQPPDLIIIALPWQAALRVYHLLERLQPIGTAVMIPFTEDGFARDFAEVAEIAGTPGLRVTFRPLSSYRLLLKRLEDYGLALLALVLAAPIMALTALALWLEERAPVLEQDQRVGFDHRPFALWRFRTTRQGAPSRIGHVITLFKIDRWPRLFNVLRGDLSFIGPRAHVPDHLIGHWIYYEAMRDHAARRRIKPGLTGWAEVNGITGTIASADQARRGAALDLYYIEHWSFGFDLKILLHAAIGSGDPPL